MINICLSHICSFYTCFYTIYKCIRSICSSLSIVFISTMHIPAIDIVIIRIDSPIIFWQKNAIIISIYICQYIKSIWSNPPNIKYRNHGLVGNFHIELDHLGVFIRGKGCHFSCFLPGPSGRRADQPLLRRAKPLGPGLSLGEVRGIKATLDGYFNLLVIVFFAINGK